MEAAQRRYGRNRAAEALPGNEALTGITLVLSLVMMAGLFLMLYSAVALIQNRKLFTSAPKDIQAVILPKKERFPGAHGLGWKLLGISVLLILGPLLVAAADGMQKNFSFGQYFGRFVLMLLLLKAFDILFFDWFLLCHSNFFPRYYPETKELVGPHQFGFNWKSHLLMIILSPLLACLLAWICTALC